MRRLLSCLPLTLALALLVGCNRTSNERQVCERFRSFLLETVGDLMPAVTDEELEQQYAACVEDYLRIKSEIGPERYDEMIKCKLEARDVPTFSGCGVDEKKGPDEEKARRSSG